MGKALEEHIACPQPGCGSSDGYCTYQEDDGSVVGHCYACSQSHRVSGNGEYIPKEKPMTESTPREMLMAPISVIADRRLSEKTARKYDIGTTTVEGKEYRTFGYYDQDGKKRMSKVRGPNKCFSPREDSRCGPTGDTKAPLLFGIQSFKPRSNTSITITEGEYDAASYFQMTGFPAVSVRSSGQAVKDVRGNYEWLAKWKEVVICFDNDPPGKKAAREIANMFPGKCRVMHMSEFKDANEYLMKNAASKFEAEWYDAQAPKIDGLITGVQAIMKLALQKPQKGISTIWSGLTYVLRGIRLQEVLTFGGGTGLGKSELVKEILFGIMKMHKEKTGSIMLEEGADRTVQCYIGKQLNKRYYLEDVEFPPEEELLQAAEVLAPYMTIADKCKSEWSEVKIKIEYMVNALGIKYIAVDHLTAIAEGKGDNVNGTLHEILEDLNHMAVSLNCTFFCISHLNQAANKNYTEGAHVSLRDFYGSGAIMQRSNFVFGFEGDLNGEKIEKNVRLLKCLKDRNAGDRGGCKVVLQYDTETGRLNEFEPEEDGVFKDANENA
tara:strand:- start:5827 stop:7482 length:1656 start_codon:yes stop_codon:yes gene_type:complete